MQHYEAPTRLLDFTFSFEIALYFALRDSWNTDCAIWIINKEQINEKTVEGIKNTGIEIPDFIYPRFMNNKYYKARNKTEKMMIQEINGYYSGIYL